MTEQEIAMAGPSSGRILRRNIICPLCPNDTQGFTRHSQLLKHIADIHEVKITRSNQQFSNFEEFPVWGNQRNREVDYVSHSKFRNTNGEEIIIYSCNRSETRGYISQARKRKTKIGGTIQIKGVCPSRIEARILINGQVSTEFIETHVGHEDELRTKQLKKSEESQIVDL